MSSNKRRKNKIIKLRNKEYTYQEIADKYKISRQRIHQIITGYRSPLIIKKYNKNGKTIYERKLEGLDFLKEKIRRRDNHTCQECGKKWIEGTRRLDVHHKSCIPSQTDAMVYKNNKNPDDLITLCHKCHLNIKAHRANMSMAMRKYKQLTKTK